MVKFFKGFFMKYRLFFFGVWLIFCITAQQENLPREIASDHSVAPEVVFACYNQLPDLVKKSVNFYRVEAQRIYWMSACLKPISVFDVRAVGKHDG